MSAVARDVLAGWRLRPMTSVHVPEIAAIDRRAYTFPWSAGIFRDCLRAGYSGWILLAEDDALAGYGLLSMGAGEAHILNLCVAPEYQHRGYGRILLMHLLSLARAADVQEVLLEVRPSNRIAIALYRDVGFARIGVRRGYYPDDGRREDALVYSLILS